MGKSLQPCCSGLFAVCVNCSVSIHVVRYVLCLHPRQKIANAAEQQCPPQGRKQHSSHVVADKICVDAGKSTIARGGHLDNCLIALPDSLLQLAPPVPLAAVPHGAGRVSIQAVPAHKTTAQHRKPWGMSAGVWLFICLLHRQPWSIPAGCLYPDRPPCINTLSASLTGCQHHSGRLSRLMACKHHLTSEECHGRTL